MAILIHENGIVEKVTPKSGKDFTVEELQSLVKGNFEVGKRFQKDENSEEFFVICNEDGLALAMPYNALGSEMALKVLVGPVVICNGVEFH